MKNQPLYQLSLLDALAALREKQFSAAEYVTELQRRIAERDGDIEAWAHYEPRQALDAARRADMHARRTASRLPLGMQLQTLFCEADVARKGIAQLEKENDKLWQENSRLWEKNERLAGMVEKYQAADEEPDDDERDDDADESDDDDLEEG